MKKIIALILSVILVFGIIGTQVSANMADQIVEKIGEYSKEDRASMILLIKSFVVSDSGVDLLVDAVKKYTPSSTDMISEVIGKLLEYSDEETLTKAFLSLKLIDEDIREKYYDAFRNKETVNLSSEAEKHVDKLVQNLFENPGAFYAICEEDGITNEVIAKTISAIVEINGGKALFTDSPIAGKLEYKTVSSSMEKLFSEASSYGKDKAEFLAKINSDADYITAIKKVGAEIGLYEAKKTPVNNNQGPSAPSVKPSVPDKDKLDKFEIKNAGKYTQDVAKDNLMLYKIEGEQLIPQKFFVIENGKAICQIETPGTYAFFEINPVFADCAGLWGENYITNLYYRGIISGRGENVFDPNGKITREEFVKLLCELFGLTDNGNALPFTDVPRDAWYYKYVAAAYQNGLVNGVSATEFGTGANILRQDMCKIICLALSKTENMPGYDASSVTITDEKNVSEYAKEYVKALYSLGLISGNERGEFMPLNNATRQETAKIIYNVINLAVKN